MRRKLNVKLIAVILGGCLVVAGAGYFLHQWQLGRNAYLLLDLGDQALADKDDAKALLLYAQYLTFVPGDLNAVQKYAQVLDRRAADSQRNEVVARMELVLLARPNEQDLRLRLVHNLIAIDRIPDAIAHLNKLLPQSTDKAEVWHMLGWCHEAKKDYATAMVSFREALKLNPGQFKTYDVLTEVLQDRLNQPDEALQVMDAMVRANPVSHEAYLLRSRFHRRRGDEALAEVDLLAALKHGPTEPAVISEAASSAIARADSLAAKKDFAAAKALLEEARTSYPREIIVWCAMADLAANQQQWTEAEQLLDEAAAVFANRVELKLAKIRLWSRHGTPADLAKLVRLGDADRASVSIEDRARVDRELAETWYRLGDWQRAEQFWLSLTRDLRKDLPGRLYLLELALEKNQLDVAHKWHGEIRAIEGDQGPLTRFGAAALLVKEAHGDRQKIDAARKLIKDLKNDYHDLPRLSLLSATIFEMEGQFQHAISEYSKAVQLGDTRPRTLARLLELLIQRREYAKAESELVRYEYQQKMPLTPGLARLGAEVWLGLRDKQSAAVALRRAELAAPLPSRDYRDYLWLARIHQAAGDHAKAESLLRMSIELAGHTPNTWLALIEHLTQANEPAQARTELDRMRQALAKDRQPLASARAYEAMRMPAEAEEAYRTALQATPDHVGLLVAAADFHRRADRSVEAQRLYERLLRPTLAAPAEVVVTARRHLAVLLAERGKSAAALALLDNNRKTLGETVADDRIRLFIHSQDEQTRQASLQKFQASAQRHLPTPDERLLLARMLESAGELSQARTLLAEIVDQQPTNPQYLARYAQVLIRAGELDDARRIVPRLEVLEPTSERVGSLKSALATAK